MSEASYNPTLKWRNAFNKLNMDKLEDWLEEASPYPKFDSAYYDPLFRDRLVRKMVRAERRWKNAGRRVKNRKKRVESGKEGKSGKEGSKGVE
jgi:16S rRNA G966 N2-methylase RsmD